jgi:hypothetical protein
MHKMVTVLVTVLISTTALAEISVGNYVFEAERSTFDLPLPNTVIDVTSGATGNGNIGAVVIRSTSNSCPGNAIKVKFFRGNDPGDLTMIAERGPFPITDILMKVDLVPPVAVQQGDLIGITHLQTCARAMGQGTTVSKSSYQYAGDITSTVGVFANWLPGFALAAYGAETSTSGVRTQVIVVAGVAQGQGGSLFKTDLFFSNLRSRRSAGRLVFHRAGVTGSSSDPSFPFSVEPTGSVTFPNFVGTSLGLSNVVGSIDVYTTVGFEPPAVTARIYDDPGTGGTKGFTVDALKVEEALQTFQNAALFTPISNNYRMNIGIRTLAAGEIQFLHLSAGGASRAFVTKNYPADYFIQDSAAAVTGVQPQPCDHIVVYSQQTAFYAYGSIIDNANNDPSLQVARHLK